MNPETTPPPEPGTPEWLRKKANLRQLLNTSYGIDGVPRESVSLRQAADRLEHLEKTLAYVRSLGVVYTYPDDWDFQGMGLPEMQHFGKVDLSEL